VTIVSVNSQGEEATDDCFFPALSEDGRRIAFKSPALNLAPNKTEPFFDVFVHDRETGATEAVSVDPLGEFGDDHSYPPALSDDGNLVAFASRATTLLGPGGDNNRSADVFVRDLTTGGLQRVSVTNAGTEVPGETRDIPPSISGNGRFVAFETTAALVSDDPNTDLADVYVFDRETHTAELLSWRRVTRDPEGAFAPAISRDGCVIAFVTKSRRLLPEGSDADDRLDVYLRDRCTDPPATERVSVAADGNPRNFADSQASLLPPALDDTGSRIAFDSDSWQLVPGDTNGVTDVFVRDRRGSPPRTIRVSVSTAGEEANGPSGQPSISGDGRYVVFVSSATNLVPGPGETDPRGPTAKVFVRDLTTGDTCLVRLGDGWSPADGDSAHPVISRDGQWIAFEFNLRRPRGTHRQPGDRDILVVRNQRTFQDCPPPPPPPTPTLGPSDCCQCPEGTPLCVAPIDHACPEQCPQEVRQASCLPETGCATFTPTPTPIPCATHADCPEGLVCIDNKCVEPPPCETNADCPSDLQCSGGHCVPRPTPRPSLTPTLTHTPTRTPIETGVPTAPPLPTRTPTTVSVRRGGGGGCTLAPEGGAHPFRVVPLVLLGLWIHCRRLSARRGCR